jgi:hypothetical protein
MKRLLQLPYIFHADEHAEDKDAKAVMTNITAQGGLTATLEKRKIKVLVVKSSPRM